jgi:hypothetical protein
MLQIELVPDLSHCIETVAKREYREATAKLLAGPKESNELVKRIELLRTFLETMDFRKLRQESENYLVEGRTVKFIFYLENGSPKYEMIVT